MTFPDAVRSVLGHYATFRGRSGRPEFWWWVLFTMLLDVAITAVDQLTGARIWFAIVSALVSLALLLPTLAVSVRRLHDSNLSGLWVLLPLGGTLAGGVVFFLGIGALLVGFSDNNEPTMFELAVALWVAAGVLLVAAVVVQLVLMLRRSTPGPNRFGPPPGGIALHPTRGFDGYGPGYPPTW